jgi:hypothetical protein
MPSASVVVEGDFKQVAERARVPAGAGGAGVDHLFKLVSGQPGRDALRVGAAEP